MTSKQKLLLFLIDSDSGIRSIYGLIKYFDRADFPENVGEENHVFIQHGLIKVSKWFNNGKRSNYAVTEKGIKYISENFNDNEILEHINEMPNPYFYIN